MEPPVLSDLLLWPHGEASESPAAAPDSNETLANLILSHYPLSDEPGFKRQAQRARQKKSSMIQHNAFLPSVTLGGGGATAGNSV